MLLYRRVRQLRRKLYEREPYYIICIAVIGRADGQYWPCVKYLAYAINATN